MESKFNTNDNVWAADQGKLYPARVVKIHAIGPIIRYLIHYNGWARKFDCWVDDQSLLPKMADVIPSIDDLPTLASSNSMSKSNGKSSSASDTKHEVTKIVERNDVRLTATEAESHPFRARENSEVASVETSVDMHLEAPTKSVSSKKKVPDEASKKRKILANADLICDEEEESFALQIPIPFLLKRYLVDEWSLITKEPKRLLQLPKQQGKSAHSFIMDYLEFKKRKVDVSDYANTVMFCKGLMTYFEKALSTILLYRHEHSQYNRLEETLFPSPTEKQPDSDCTAASVRTQIPSVRMSTVYGVEHFLRLFARITRLLNAVFSKVEDVEKLRLHLLDVLKFMEKNAGKYMDSALYGLADEVMVAEIVYSPPPSVGVETDCNPEEDCTSGRKKRKTAGINPRFSED